MKPSTASPRESPGKRTIPQAGRIAVLMGCIALALLATLFLNLVWEMRIDGEDYRRLYPATVLNTLTTGIAVTGLGLLLIEFFRALRIPLATYPVLLLLYLGALIAATHLFSYDFAISRTHPLSEESRESTGPIPP